MQPVRGALFVLALAGAIGCSGPRAEGGPVSTLLSESAERSGVSKDLVTALAVVEGGYRLALHRDVEPGELVEVAGALEIRHGGFDSLGRGVALTGASSLELQRDLALGTEAGVRVLAELGNKRGAGGRDLASWSEAIEEMSGHLALGDRIDYRARVMRALREGRTVKTRSGEEITVAAHPEIPIGLTIAPPPERTLGTPDHAGAIWFETPSADKWTPGREAAVSMIAIHDTQGGWEASVATLQHDVEKSVHYIVDADGSRVGQFVHEKDTAWHVGNYFYNSRMIGIEHVGMAEDDAYQTPMYETSARLVRDIAKRNHLGAAGDGTHLDRSVLVGHQEVPNGNLIPADSPPCSDSPASCTHDVHYGGSKNHTDPGVFWEWCHYADIIGEGAACKCNDVYDHFNCSLDGTFVAKCPDGVVETKRCSSCVVEADGVDDTCNPVLGTSSSSGDPTNAGGGPGSGGGGPKASGGGGGGAPAMSSGSRVDGDSGCSFGAGEPPSVAWLLLIGAGAWRSYWSRRKITRSPTA